jgi:tape measure domain-containing protein
MAEILVQFAPKGDEEVLDAIKKVTRHVGDLKRIAKTPIDLQIARNAMRPDDFNRLKTTINKAKDATTDWSKETTKLWKEQEKLAKAAERAANSAAKTAKMSPTMGGITGSMMGGGGGKGPILPLGTSGLSSLPDPKAFSPKAINELNTALGNTPKKAQAAGQSLGFVGRIIAAMAVRSFVREVYEMANAWTAFENKIKTVLTVQSDLAFVTKDLIGISQRSRTSLEAVGTIYTRTSRAVSALGKSQIEVARFTETLSKAVAVGGSTSIEAKNAMIQLSQGMSSGTLKGDELRSVLEQLPIVAELIAKKMGVTVGQLRKLGSEGKLTTDVVFGAITEATAGIEAQFAKMKPTMESIVQVIKDKFMVAIGQSSGILDKVTKALGYLSDNFDIAFRAATALAGVMTTIATGRFAVWMAMGLANPWIALAAAIAAATVAYVAFADKIEMSKDGALKLSGVTSAWTSTFSKDIKDIIVHLEKIISIFGIPLKFSWDVDTMIDRMAVATDLIRVMLSPDKLAVAAVRNSPEDQEWAKRTQNALKRERALAKGAEKDAFWVKQNETEARWNATMRGINQAGAVPPPPAKKGTKEHGKTFDELIKEATFDERNSLWDETEEKIRDRLHNMMEKLKPSIKAAMEDVESKIAAAKRDFDSEYAKNDGWGLNPAGEARARKSMEDRIAGIRKANEHYKQQADQLDDIVRQEATREYYAKRRLEDEKEMEAFLDERLKQMKEMEDLNKSMLEEAADRQVSRAEGFKGIMGGLDPNFATRQQITELENFERFAKENRLADWAKLAKDRIDELKASMRWENTHFETFASQMTSIFGPGGTLVKGFADAAANAIVMSESLSDLRRALVDVLNSVQKQALSSLIQLPMNLALGALTNSLTGGGATSSLTSEAGGVRMLSAAEASTVGQPKFASGGFTGYGSPSAPAGIVHGQEYVLNADATRRMGKQNLDLINKGATPSSGSTPTSITINNNAGVQVEAREMSPGQIEVMITKAIRDQTGRVVAGLINDPNSSVSRSMQKNLDTGRRRV